MMMFSGHASPSTLGEWSEERYRVFDVEPLEKNTSGRLE